MDKKQIIQEKCPKCRCKNTMDEEDMVYYLEEPKYASYYAWNCLGCGERMNIQKERIPKKIRKKILKRQKEREKNRRKLTSGFLYI